MENRLTEIEVYSGWKNKTINDGELENKKFEITLEDKVSSKYIKEKLGNMVDRYVPGAVKEVAESARRACSTIWPRIHKDYAINKAYSGRLSNHEVVQQGVRDVAALPRKALARLEYFIAGIESVADTLEKRSASESQK